MRAFLINLDRNPERLAFMRGQLDRLGIPFERFPAVYGRELSPEARAKGFSRVRSFIASKKRLSDAEIGVAMSHVGCCRRMVEANDRYALVLEDDVVLSDRFAETLSRVEAFLNPGRPQRREVGMVCRRIRPDAACGGADTEGQRSRRDGRRLLQALAEKLRP